MEWVCTPCSMELDGCSAAGSGRLGLSGLLWASFSLHSNSKYAVGSLDLRQISAGKRSRVKSWHMLLRRASSLQLELPGIGRIPVRQP